MVIDYIGKQHQDCHKEDVRTVEKTTRIVDFIGMSIKNGQNATEIHYRA